MQSEQSLLTGKLVAGNKSDAAVEEGGCELQTHGFGSLCWACKVGTNTSDRGKAHRDQVGDCIRSSLADK